MLANTVVCVVVGQTAETLSSKIEAVKISEELQFGVYRENASSGGGEWDVH